MEKIDNFKSELIALLKKYNATIGCNVYGDTHGLTYEMTAYFQQGNKWEECILNDGAEISYNDIK